MEYLGIKNLLNKFHKRLLDKRSTEEALIDILGNLTEIKLSTESISYKNKKIHIKARNLIKTEIMLKKEKILFLLKEKGFFVDDII